MTIETLTTASVSPWTAPAGVTSVQVELWGSGGKGSSRTSNGGGGGGGGGAYTRVNSYTVVPGNTYDFQVGIGATVTPAAPEQHTWWISTTTAFASRGQTLANNTATGGNGGLAANGIGDVVQSGGSGADGVLGSYGGGGGESGYDGGDGTTATVAAGGTGTAGGDGGAGKSPPQGNGSNGVIPGGGGGGGYRTSSGTRAGGNGADGQIVLTYTATDFSGTASLTSTETVTVEIRKDGLGLVSISDTVTCSVTGSAVSGPAVLLFATRFSTMTP